VDNVSIEEIEKNIYGQTDEISTEKENESSSKKWKKIILFLLIFVFVIAVICIVWHYFQIWVLSLIDTPFDFDM